MLLMFLSSFAGDDGLDQFSTMLDCLQSAHSLLSGLLTGQEGLHYRDICYLPLQHTLKMQHVPYTYFTSLVHENYFQPEGMTIDAASHTTAILLVFLSDDQHKTIEYIHIGLVVRCTGYQLYNEKAIPWFIKSIEDDLKKARSKQAAGKDPGEACSFSMFVSNFGSLMAVPTDPPYYLNFDADMDEEKAFHESNRCIMMWCSPVKRCLDLM